MDNINRLTLADEHLLTSIPKEFGLGQVLEGRSATLLSNQSNIWIAAIENEQIIGLLIGYEIALLYKSEVLLYSIDTLEMHRRKGIGRKMVQLLCDVCSSLGIANIWIPTNESSLAAMAFYHALGATRKANDDVIFNLEVKSVRAP